MISLPLFPTAIAMLLLTGTAACSRPRPVRPQATSGESQPAAVDPARNDHAARADPAEGGASATSSGARDPEWTVLQSRIYFDFDRSDLTAESRNSLSAKLGVLLANPEIQVQIVGHADERGSDEYNLALGLERAAAARRFLTQRGVSPERISVISMGEEHPRCTESNESCWWQNRRDEFVIMNVGRAQAR